MKYLKVNYLYVLYTIFLIYCLWPSRYAKHYEYISRDKILNNLIEKTTRNLSLLQNVKCEYNDIFEENKFMFVEKYTREIIYNVNINMGGEYYPEDCSPRFSTAIIIPYRQREKQLNEFLTYMHNYLRRQRIHYRIFVIEQYDQKPFNRAKLFNIGAMIAMKLEFPCLIFHDVDLLPLTLGQLYSCTILPRHMCSSLDQFRFHLPYLGLFGGVVSIQSKTFLQINGMSNMFQGWGGEDDDLFNRLKASNIDICRFEPDYSMYTMMKHTKETPNQDRVALLQNGFLRYHTDGLNSLVYEEKGFKLHKLFTHVLVET